ncbi:methylenetetrahydrofolate reductase [Jiangella sp. DSM 45060]|uniref:methylenetetrahydrofolate reductase n=1 Tax=Jiangella sp. DSM 45060 TaxID=1798224 RepID=UPI00087B8748|nr:methylenetetrahydrofolate reductase [Jiangella sp. DSM 45060]SDS73296.1 5,10-methylenetetrahydrofolate reductase (NAD(P)) [Jiangella sp. DSM 45060]
MTTVLERLAGRRPVFSVEFFPPRDDADETVLWTAVRQLEPLDPAFVSVTYGAGGSSRERTIRTTGRIRRETTLTPVAHLAGVGHSRAELRNVVGWYAEHGIRNVLAIRGDPPGGPSAEWVAHPDGVTYADEMVSLIGGLGAFCVGVAAFPHGHPESPDLETDVRRLLGKIRRGAHFAVAQLCFEPDYFLRLRDRLAVLGCDVPLLPGVMPLTTRRTLAKSVELSGVSAPAAVAERLARHDDDPAGFRAEGLDITTSICERLLAEGVQGLHFYTLNRSTATRELVRRLGLGVSDRVHEDASRGRRGRPSEAGAGDGPMVGGRLQG